MRPTIKTHVAAIAVAALLLTARGASGVSLAFDNPPGGWTYAFGGDSAAPGTPTGGTFDSLDGTWDHPNGSDSWDGSGIGGTIGPGNGPGGVSALVDGNTDFIRIQNTGDPRAAPTSHPDPSNRRIYLGHNIANDAGVVSPETIGEAVTMSFRARLATPATGPLDPMFPTTGQFAGVPHGTPWPAEGTGFLGHDGGKGSFGLRQSDPGPGAGTLSFSLALDTDTMSDGQPFGVTGLNMNSLAGTSPTGSVNPWNNHPTINVLPIDDLTVWHEFWLTIQADTSGGGTHRVEVFLDGSLQGTVFHVTAGTGSDYSGFSYLAMGLGATPQVAAIDVDFFAYKEGVFHPAAGLLPGDVNLDGVVDMADFEIIRANFRRNVTSREEGDLTGNGFVGFPDFQQWKGVFLAAGGSLEGVSLGFSGVPEPVTSTLMVLGLTVLGVACRRRGPVVGYFGTTRASILEEQLNRS